MKIPVPLQQATLGTARLQSIMQSDGMIKGRLHFEFTSWLTSFSYICLLQQQIGVNVSFGTLRDRNVLQSPVFCAKTNLAMFSYFVINYTPSCTGLWVDTNIFKLCTLHMVLQSWIKAVVIICALQHMRNCKLHYCIKSSMADDFGQFGSY